MTPNWCCFAPSGYFFLENANAAKVSGRKSVTGSHAVFRPSKCTLCSEIHQYDEVTLVGIVFCS